MRKVLMSFIVVLSFAVIPFNALANEVVKVEKMSFEGEEFEVKTWLDKDGVEYQTVSTDVENKVGISNYLNSLQEDKSESISLNGNPSLSSDPVYIPWRHPNLRGDDSSAKLTWDAYGWTYFESNRAQTIEVGRGYVLAEYLGIGTPDKIINAYSYTFNGTTVSLSYPPALTPSSKTLTWKSSPVTGEWRLGHYNLGASGSSRVWMSNVELLAYSEIYKGDKIYMPQINKTVKFGETTN